MELWWVDMDKDERVTLRVSGDLREKMGVAARLHGIGESAWARQALERQAEADLAADLAARAKTNELRRLGKSMVAPADCVHPKHLIKKGVFNTYCSGCGDPQGPPL